MDGTLISQDLSALLRRLCGPGASIIVEDFISPGDQKMYLLNNGRLVTNNSLESPRGAIVFFSPRNPGYFLLYIQTRNGWVRFYNLAGHHWSTDVLPELVVQLRLCGPALRRAIEAIGTECVQLKTPMGDLLSFLAKPEFPIR